MNPLDLTILRDAVEAGRIEWRRHVLQKLAEVRPPERLPQPKVELPEPVSPPVAPPQEAPAIKIQPAAPKLAATVKKTPFDTGSSAKPTIKKPVQQVQTGGFGDENSSNEPKSDSRLTIPRTGQFDLPAGAGTGNGTGGAQGDKGAVASAGFGDSVAGPHANNGNRTIASAGFGDASAPAGGSAPEKKPKPASVTPVEIISKPKPRYTDDARKRHIEGEVLLAVVFKQTGEVQVEHLVQGLGHGLDETAQEAAQQIRFQPARRDGQPFDFPATIHIVFALAE